jgi:asparagine synthase (glutamine-hydrolysing)
MCGICGFINNDRPEDENGEILRGMVQSLHHRGPDDEGYYQKHGTNLGMRRLSIIDIANGHQPITNEDQTVWIVFNGEIYNYKELRQNLLSKGHIFRTNSDTETIVHLYEEYGDDCPAHLNGMFAYAVWDEKKRKLLLARDHIGIKPLFYSWDDNHLWFGSEIKALLVDPRVRREIDVSALDQFLSLEYIPAPRTIYTHIKKLPPGHTLSFENGTATLRQYWDVTPEPVEGDFRTCSRQLAQMLAEAVKMQLISDVPVGAFLSGGIDSSTVAAFMSLAADQPVRTFSVGFSDATYNELPFAREVARMYSTNHHEEILHSNYSELCEKLVSQFDEPFGDFSIFPTYLVSKAAREHVKVVLSGDGGDELFGGYDTYRAQNFDRYYSRLPEAIRKKTIPSMLERIPPAPDKKGWVNIAKRITEGAALHPSLRHTRWMIFFNENTRKSIYQPDFSQTLNGWSVHSIFNQYFDQAKDFHPLGQQQYVDVKTYLADNILVKVDRMSMAVSLETRVPLLDFRLVQFALNLPDKMKINNGVTKRILREAVKGMLPQKVINKPKQGFSIPLKHWLRGPLRPLMEDLLSTSTLQRRGFFQPAGVSQMIKEHLDNKADHSHRLWALMVLELWQQRDSLQVRLNV